MTKIINNTTGNPTTEPPIVGMQCCGLPLIDEAVDWCAYRLLFTRHYDTEAGKVTEPVMYTSETVTEALLKAIGLGGGTWMPEKLQPYWMFNYYSALYIELLKTIDGEIITEIISKKRLMFSANKIWNENKKNWAAGTFLRLPTTAGGMNRPLVRLFKISKSLSAACLYRPVGSS